MFALGKSAASKDPYNFSIGSSAPTSAATKGPIK